MSDTAYKVSSIDKILDDSWGYMLCKALSCLMQKIIGGYGIYGIGMIYESSKEMDKLFSLIMRNHDKCFDISLA